MCTEAIRHGSATLEGKKHTKDCIGWPWTDPPARTGAGAAEAAETFSMRSAEEVTHAHTNKTVRARPVVALLPNLGCAGFC